MPSCQPYARAEALIMLGRYREGVQARWKIPPTIQTASEHYLPPWGMKPTVLDQRNPLDLHTLTRTH